MTEHQGKMFKNFSKLPLKKVTLVIQDGMFLQPLTLDHPNLYGWNFYDEMEQQYRWTMEQKQDFSKEVRDVLLRRADKEMKGE